MKFALKKLNIRTKVTIAYFSFGFLSLIAFNLIWLLPSLTETKENAANIQLEAAKRGAREIEAFVSYKIDLLEEFAHFFSYEEAMQTHRTLLDHFIQRDQAFFEIVHLDKQGREKIKVSLYDIFSEDDLADQSQADYFLRALGGNIFISEVLFSEKAEPYVVLSIPVFSSQKETDGVLVVKLKLTEMWEVVSGLSITAKSHVFVVDEKGRLIADQNPSVVLKGLILADQPIVKAVIEDREIITGFSEQGAYLDKSNQRVLTVGVPLEGLPWGLIIERPEADAYEGFSKKIVAFVLISILGGLATILAARWLARYLSNPLKKLSEGAKIIGSGDLDFRLDIKTGDEVEGLADAFNEMAGQLKDSYYFLERKVELRTQELKSQRDQLDKVAEKLIHRDIVLNEVREQQEKALVEAREAQKKAEQARYATLNVLEDINEARRAQTAEKNKVEAVLLSLVDGLIALDEDGKIALINGQAEALLGIKKEDVISKRLEEISIQSVENIVLFLKKKKAAPSGEALVLEQGAVTLEIVSAPVIDAAGGTSGQLIILHDATREKAIEKMKSEFVSIAAHQLRTPLSAIKWTLRLVLDEDLGPISSQQAEILKKGYQSNERMIYLVNDLLNVARIEEGRFIYKFAPVEFIGLLKEVIDGLQPLARIKSIMVKFYRPGDDKIHIMADEEKIKLAVQNLIENAINYSPVGSEVTISVKCDKINMAFEVADKGMGVQKDQKNRLFSKFFRGDNAVKMETEGTGLGLFIAKNIIEGHGGKVWFESEVGKGSTFYFSLPLKLEATKTPVKS